NDSTRMAMAKPRIAQRWRRASARVLMTAFSCPLAEAAEHALRPQEDDQQEDDEDRGVLQLVGQDQRRHLLHDADQQPTPERTEIAAETAEHDPGIHDDDKIEPDIRLERLERRDETAGDGGDAHADAPGDAMRPV